MEAASLASPLRSDLPLLALLASIPLIVHIYTGNGYGFHRDELQFLDDARHLHFGFVAYPPLTAFCGRIAIALFGISPEVFRLPAAIVNALSLIVVGLLARELGGRRPAQALALLLSLPVTLAFSSVLQYNTFDYFAWALAALFTARLLRTANPRWWIAIGAAIGLGILSKYSIAALAISIVAASIALPTQRHHLRTRWFYLGALTALAVAAPNLLWLASHHFITLEMEHHIHIRDVALGRAKGYFTDQLKYTLLALPLLLVGLIHLLRSPRFRPLAFLFLGPFVLFAVARGRGYYLLPAYIVLNAAGAVALEHWLRTRSRATRISVRTLAITAALADTVAIASLFLPIATPGSTFFHWQMRANDDLAEEIGWPGFVNSVATVYESLPPGERDRVAILAENYGEAGALALYGPGHNLPTPLSDVNSFHDRGFGPFPPENVIVTGNTYDDLIRNFESCRLAGHVEMPFGIQNMETRYGRDIFVCHHLRRPWNVLWPESQHFG